MQRLNIQLKLIFHLFLLDWLTRALKLLRNTHKNILHLLHAEFLPDAGAYTVVEGNEFPFLRGPSFPA